MRTPLLEEDVRLVDEDHGFPELAQLEDGHESLLDLLGRDAQLATTDDVQWTFQRLADRFRRERLACARLTVQQHDQTPAFPADHIAGLSGVCEYAGANEAGENFLLPLIHDQAVDSLVSPVDMGEVIDAHL